MEYIDTNILISLIDKKDGKYNLANELMKIYNNKIITELNLLEMKSVLSRSGIINEEIDALEEYLLIKYDIKMVDIDFNRSINAGKGIISFIKLKTLDCLHIANAIIIHADKFITFNNDFKKKKEDIKKYGIEIIYPL
jgi:predicted nucleic acid-binding protein